MVSSLGWSLSLLLSLLVLLVFKLYEIRVRLSHKGAVIRCLINLSVVLFFK